RWRRLRWTAASSIWRATCSARAADHTNGANWRRASLEKRGEVLRADLAAIELVPLGRPMRFQADRPGVAVAPERRDLSPPVDAHLADRPPGHLATVHRAVLGMHVRDARLGKPLVAIRVGALAEDEGVGGIPDR